MLQPIRPQRWRVALRSFVIAGGDAHIPLYRQALAAPDTNPFCTSTSRSKDSATAMVTDLGERANDLLSHMEENQ